MSELKPMHGDEDGWSEWVNPAPGYLMGCCDCGLVHEMEFVILRFADATTSSGDVVQDPALGVAFRAKRAETQRSHFDATAK